jgi:hypothetical protein
MNVWTTIARAAAVMLVGGISTGIAVAEERLAANAAEDGAVDAARQCDVYIVGVATSTGEGPLRFRWRDGSTDASAWQEVRADGSAPLELCGLSVGRHALTLEVTDGKRVVSDTMTAIIDRGPALVAQRDSVATP